MTDKTDKLALPNSMIVKGDEWNAMREQASMLVKSGFLPSSVNTAEKAIAIALMGREIGIPIMQAMRQINVINGKPTCSAELMLALAYRAIPGFKAEPTEDTDEAFTITFTRPGMKPFPSRFTMKDAERAGLCSKEGSMFKKYPRAMLRARAISAGLRLIAPDALMGMSYTPEELGAVVNEEGEVISAPIQGEVVEVISCSDCGCEVDEKTAKASAKHFDGVVYCVDCGKKQKNGNGGRKANDPTMARLCILCNEVFGTDEGGEQVMRQWFGSEYGVESRTELSESQKVDAITRLEEMKQSKLPEV